jgi:hypothetical protein
LDVANHSPYATAQLKLTELGSEGCAAKHQTGSHQPASMRGARLQLQVPPQQLIRQTPAGQAHLVQPLLPEGRAGNSSFTEFFTDYGEKDNR